MAQIPVLILSDSPDLPTGLARITRDLARHLIRLPQFQVATLGRGGYGSAQLPFHQYNFGAEEQWGERILSRCWNDFAGSRKGIIFTIWDPSRLFWFGVPRYWPDDRAREFLSSGRFSRWGYFPVDAPGVGRGLTAMGAETVRGYNRVLGYTIFGAEILGASLGRTVDWIPHGINCDVFTPKDRVAARMATGIPEDKRVLGCVMTNQARKDWGLLFAIISNLVHSHGMSDLVLWAHVDVLDRHWSIPALIADYHLEGRVMITHSLKDEEMAYYYSACDLTLLPSLGEGFGYPLVESLACGVPVLHGAWGGGAELIPDRLKIQPAGQRLDTLHNVVRPVFDPLHWVDKVVEILEERPRKEEMRAAVEHLHWKKLWPVWERWVLEGVETKEGK